MPMPQRRLPPSWPTDGTGLRSPTTSSPGGSLLSSPAGSSNDLQRYVLGLSPLSSLPSFAACCSAAPSCQPSSSADAHASQRAVEAPTHPRQHERSGAAATSDVVKVNSSKDSAFWPDLTLSTPGSSDSLWSNFYSSFSGPSTTTAAAKAKAAAGAAAAGGGAASPAPASLPLTTTISNNAGSQPWAVNPGSQWMCYRGA